MKGESDYGLDNYKDVEDDWALMRPMRICPAPRRAQLDLEPLDAQMSGAKVLGRIY